MKINANSIAVSSPLSNQLPRKIMDLPKEFLLEKLETYCRQMPMSHIVETDYSLWQCSETGLQFSSPLLPGNPAFYEWVASFPSYYPGQRWEYKEVDNLIRRDSSLAFRNLKILDVGSGKGDFLSTISNVPLSSKYALDFNENAIKECRTKGLQAFCGTIDSALASSFFKEGDFSVVTSFHCLEHVDQPVEFVCSLLKLIASDGRVFISTPYSPMSFESDWFDILNNPPHHITRWNLASFKKLAQLTGTTMRYFFPTTSLCQQTINCFKLKKYGPNIDLDRTNLIKEMFFNLPTILQLYLRLLRRVRTNQVAGADVILVELRNT